MPNSFSPLMVSRICERSITWPPEAVVAGTVGRRRVPQPKRVRGHDGDRGSGLTAPGEDVQDHIRRVDTLTQRLLAGGLDRGQAVAQETSTNWRSPSAAPTSLRRTRSSPAGSTQFLNGAPLRRAPGLRARTGT